MVWVGWRDLGADQGPTWLTGFCAEFPDDVTTDVYKNVLLLETEVVQLRSCHAPYILYLVRQAG